VCAEVINTQVIVHVYATISISYPIFHPKLLVTDDDHISKREQRERERKMKGTMDKWKVILPVFCPFLCNFVSFVQINCTGFSDPIRTYIHTHTGVI